MGYNLPSHYDVEGYDLMDVLDAIGNRDSDVETPSMWTKRYNAIKYVVRCHRKDGAKDVRKAIDYLRRLLAEMEPGGDFGELTVEDFGLVALTACEAMCPEDESVEDRAKAELEKARTVVGRMFADVGAECMDALEQLAVLGYCTTILAASVEGILEVVEKMEAAGGAEA